MSVTQWVTARVTFSIDTVLWGKKNAKDRKKQKLTNYLIKLEATYNTNT